MATPRITITLKLNKEVRDVSVADFGDFVIFNDVVMVTTTGNKQHEGSICLKKQPEGAIYTAAHIVEATYVGMRGNGYGNTSRMRYIGFPKEAA